MVPPIYYRKPKGYDPNKDLNYLIRKGREDEAEALLDGGEDPNKIMPAERLGGPRLNALHVAAIYDCRASLLNKILDKIKNVNVLMKCTSSCDYTALMLAVNYNHLHIVKALMERPEIDLNVQSDRYGYTALHLSIIVNNPDIVKQLLSGKNINVKLRSCKNSDRFFNYDNYGDLTAFELVRQIHAEKKIEKRRMNDEQISKNGEILNIFYEHDTPIERARYMYLRDEYSFPLAKALAAYDKVSVVALLDDGDDPNEVDKRNPRDRIQIGSGDYAHTTVRDYKNNALHWAADKGCRLPLFQQILYGITYVNAKNSGGYTALMLAAKNNRLELVTALMNHPKIDLNVTGERRRTALHYAVLKNHLTIVEQLLSDDRIDYTLKDSDNRTPLKLAREIRHYECVDLLKKHEKFISKIKRGLKKAFGEKEELDDSVVELKF
jgi:ankyrin repeat protein